MWVLVVVGVLVLWWAVARLRSGPGTADSVDAHHRFVSTLGDAARARAAARGRPEGAAVADSRPDATAGRFPARPPAARPAAPIARSGRGRRARPVPARGLVAAVALVVTVGVVVWLVWRGADEGSGGRVAATDPPGSTLVTTTTTPTVTTTTEASVPRAELAADGTLRVTTVSAPFTVDLATPAGRCWVQATVDGEVVLAETLEQDETRSWRGAEVVLRLGNAGVVSIAVDGQELAPPEGGIPPDVVVTTPAA